MAGAPGYVHISQRNRAAAVRHQSALAEGAVPGQRPVARPTVRSAVNGQPGDVHADRRLAPQESTGATPGSEARGFVLYVGLDETKAAQDGTTLVEVVQHLRRAVGELSPQAETYAAVALAQTGALGTDLEVVRNALGDPTSGEQRTEPAPPLVRQNPETRASQSAGVLIDLSRREVLLDGDILNLTYKEFELLNYLVENGSRTVGRGELIGSLWCDAEETPNERTIDVHIRRLRSKLGRLANTVRTVRGQGYRFYDHPEVVVWAAPEYSI
ncbi:winged helix-turn-helix transcriptional regulator [Kocuria sp. JC486]|uniref:Winged helix family transcriptional regulator n=1 Tax=Kocuria soli TaxID=2485125 RepID=A0A3N3ZV35_9MICC|nr:MULTISPECIES: winged helix-turn-helix domain-containing protein [Kocuria]NHU86330.1 winged helix-turn-helix transcriptional regulator [Kocuria sp. JC486]ROZ65686.1 winged helix family transcriptional regulator [Kocuria soli]